MRYTLLMCGLMVALGASAEAGHPRPLKGFQSFDLDGDQMVSLAETEQVAPHLAARFGELDTNNDGLLSHEEIAAGRAMPAPGGRGIRSIEEDFTAADGNKDGRLSRDEAQGMPIVSDFFNEIDTSKDGYVTLEEIHAHAKAHGPVIKHIRYGGRQTD